MSRMAKSEKPAVAGELKLGAKKSIKPRSAPAVTAPRPKLSWAQTASRGTAAKPSLRPKPTPERLKPPPLPKGIDEGALRPDEMIDVNPDWLESAAPSRGASKRASKPAKQLHFVEAVRVLIGPNGEIVITPDPADVPAGYIEAVIVATSSGLAGRLLKR
jgi:hypothetical protein